ncbi:MAG TPA: hypothetical protein VFI40_04715 [Nocardioides sp.]|nr:hypothetical protein [Nocardioides sp.]
MENQIDQNIMDAWSKGGEVDGKPVTDEMVLAHWRDRLAHVAKDDPLYDKYSEAISQYEYAIAESKASTAYAQGKLSDAAMAQFYLGWAKKVPKNSEFWRVLQRDAAQFMRASASKGAASAAKTRELIYQKAQDGDYAKYEKAGDYITNVMRQLARSNALIGADLGTDLTQFDTSDPAKMLQLLDTITVSGSRTPGEDKGNTAVLYHDPISGKAVTGADIVAQLHALDPTFDGRVTLTYVRQLLTRQQQGQAIRLQRAQDTGHATDVNNLKKWQEYTSEIGREANLWPVEQQYNGVRQTFLSTWLSATATPDEKMQAWKDYSQSLARIAGGANVDDSTRARLMAEVNGDGSVKSLAEDLTGLNSADNTTTTGQTKGDIADTAFDVQRYAAMQQAVAQGAAVWTTGSTVDGVFRPKVGGSEIGAATLQDIQATSPVAPVVIFVPQGGGAKAIPVVVSGGNVTATATNDKGERVNVTDQNPVGAFYDVTVGGFKTRVYSFLASDGKTYYSTSTPWDDNGVRAHDTPQGVTLDLSAYVPHQDAGGNWVYANGQAADVSGNGAFGLSNPDNEGNSSIVMNPAKAVYTSDPTHAASGIDPATDFFSPTLAALMSSAEGLQVLGTLKDDPQFQAQLQFEAQKAATNSQGQIDTQALAKFQGQITQMTSLPVSGDSRESFNAQAYSQWGRTSTTPTFAAVGTNVSAGKQADDRFGPTVLPATPTTLPSDAVRNTQFAALGAAFRPGTNMLAAAFPGKQADDTLQLQLAGQIKVPAVPTPTITPPAPTVQAVTTTVAPAVSPVVTTVSAPTVSQPAYAAPPTRTAF